MTSAEVDPGNPSHEPEKPKGPDHHLLRFVEGAKSASHIKLSTGWQWIYIDFTLIVFASIAL